MTHSIGSAALTLILLLSAGSSSASTPAQSRSACGDGMQLPSAEGVYLYKNSRFAGPCARFTGDVENLAGTPVGDNSASSVLIIGDYAATLYQNPGFAGISSTLVSSANNLRDAAVGTDRTSSLRVRKGGCNDEPGVYLYERPNFSGRCTKFTADAPDFRIHYIQPNAASSIKLIGDWVATLYAAEGFHGTVSRFEANDSNLAGNSIRDNRARSIAVNPRERVCDGGPGVYLYASKRYQGTCSRFTNTVGDLSAYTIGNNTASSIRLVGGYSATLYIHKTYDAKASNSTFTTDDPDLSNDAVREDRASSIRVQGPNPELDKVYRVQIRIETGDVDDAGTDDDVLVSLNQKNFTWLDYGRNDFQRGDTYTYDLLLDDVARISSIKWITFNKTGSDDWCIKSFELLINHQALVLPPVRIYREEFPTCRWLDDKNGDRRSLTIPFAKLRAQSAWRQARIPGTIGAIDRTELISRIEGAVGHALHYESRASWGESYGKSVEIGYIANPPHPSGPAASDHRAQRIHVDLDLAGTGLGTDVEIDVDFDILVNCAMTPAKTAIITLKTDNIRANVNWFVDWFGGGIENQIERAFPTLSESFGSELRDCGSVRVLDDGTIRIAG